MKSHIQSGKLTYDTSTIHSLHSQSIRTDFQNLGLRYFDYQFVRFMWHPLRGTFTRLRWLAFICSMSHRSHNRFSQQEITDSAWNCWVAVRRGLEAGMRCSEIARKTSGISAEEQAALCVPHLPPGPFYLPQWPHIFTPLHPFIALYIRNVLYCILIWTTR